MLNEYAAKMAIEMESWSPEEIKYFRETFVHKRGHINIPKEPINWPVTNTNMLKTTVSKLQLESGCPYFRFVNTSNYPLIAS
ncbi:MAG: hypothetical protein ACKO6A_09080 [Bacteroidota bacterium]